MCTNEEFLVKFFLISTILIAICYGEQLHFLIISTYWRKSNREIWSF